MKWRQEWRFFCVEQCEPFCSPSFESVITKLLISHNYIVSKLVYLIACMVNIIIQLKDPKSTVVNGNNSYH